MELFKSQLKKISKSIPSGLWVLSVCIILNGIFSLSNNLADILYFRGFFQGIRWLVDFSIAKLPFPLVGALFIFLIWGLIYVFFVLFNNKDSWKERKFWINQIVRVISFAGWVLRLFDILWGFNYHNPSLESELDLQLAPMRREELVQKINWTETQLLKIRNEISKDSQTAILPVINKNELEFELRELLKQVLRKWGYPCKGDVRVRKLKPGGMLLSFSTQGIYIPFVSEGNIDGGLHPLSWPSTMCHEMAHGYGFTGEGTCEFISFIACSKSEDPVIRYSGWMSYYEYLLRDFRRNDKEAFEKYRNGIPREIKIDFAATREYADRYPRLIPALQSRIHNQYLKAHGMKDGKLNYNRIVMLVDAWERKMEEGAK